MRRFIDEWLGLVVFSDVQSVDDPLSDFFFVRRDCHVS